MKSRNKQKREKRKTRKKHPELGRTVTVQKSASSRFSTKKDKKIPTCPKCNQILKHHKFIRGTMIKNICKCNEYLLEKETEKILEKQSLKLDRPLKPGQSRTIDLNKE